MISPADQHRFSRLAAVLERARAQRSALIDRDLARFEQLAEERRGLLDDLAASLPDAELPDNITLMPTALREREEDDTRLACDLLIRAVLQEDQRNEALLQATFGCVA